MPMHSDAPKHRCNEVFLALQLVSDNGIFDALTSCIQFDILQVLFHPLSSDLVVEQAFSALK